MRKLIYREFKYDIREMDSETGMVSGYASTFNVPIPYYDEVMLPGSFTKTIQESGGKVPILRGHRGMIGRGHSAREDKVGLLVEGRILVDKIQDAREEFALMEQSMQLNAPHGISIGMEILKADIKLFKPTGEKLNHIHEVKLVEWSPTPFPANPTAQVTNIRDLLHIDTSKLTTDEKALVARFLKELGAADADEPITDHSDSDGIALLIAKCGEVRQAAAEFNEPTSDHSFDGVRSSLDNLLHKIEVTR